MEVAEYYPYRSAEAREKARRYLDRQAERLWPVVREERIVPTSFGETFVRVSGPEGAPMVVLFHGAGATSLMWAPTVDALAREYRTAAVDQVGEFGKSSCVRPPRRWEDLGAWMEELVEGLAGRERVTVVGMSYGGALAAQFALRCPDRVERVALLAPASTVLRPPVEFWARLMGLAVARERGLRWFFRWVFPAMARREPEWVEARVEELVLNMRTIARHHPPIPPVLSDAQWASLRPPALFLVGQLEVIYGAEAAVRRLKRVAPQVKAEIVPGAGHDVTFAQTERVNERVLRFLKEERPRAASA